MQHTHIVYYTSSVFISLLVQSDRIRPEFQWVQNSLCVCVCFILHSVYIFIIINLKKKKGALAGWFTCIAWFGLETQVAAFGIIISPLEATSTADWPNMHTKSVSLMRYALTKDCTTTFVNMQWMTAIIFKFVHNKTRGSDLAHEWYFLLSPALFSN